MVTITWNRLVAGLRRFRDAEEGQDLIEYTLLLAFVALASAALFITSGTQVNQIWNVTNTILNNASQGLP